MPVSSKTSCIILRAQISGTHAISAQIGSHIHHDLINGVDMNILRGDILQIDMVDPGAVFHVECHPWRGVSDNQSQGMDPFADRHVNRKCPPSSAPGAAAARLIFLPHTLYDFKKAGSAGNTIGLE